MSAKEDLELHIKTLELQEAFVNAKATRGQPDHDEAAVEAASAALNEHRVFWRSIREQVAAERYNEWAATQDATDEPAGEEG